MHQHTLSVVVPAYNEEQYIGQCLAALLEQEADIHEIAVVDNNSTDRTGEIVDAIAERSPIVRRIFEPRPGVAFARNAGFDWATGDLLGRIDADTRVRPGWARTILDFFARADTASVGAVSGLSNSYDSPYRELKRRYIEQRVRKGFFGGERRIDNLHGANMAVRRSAWQRVRDAVSTDAGIHEDLDLALCLREADIEIAQLSDLFVDISPRRALTPPREYTKYIRSGTATFELHGRMNPVLRRILRAHWAFHVLVYLAYRPYDPEQGRFTLTRLLRTPRARTLPIDVADTVRV
ncbi:glycosyltransferase [Rhodococcus ruber]|uniref:glycosyltransferase n=1 Tax=Rhodococcus ruber TaxID=1830 RepID=UPI001F16EC84|nr:glycosyltransferase family 2 protein [Rhodococcus ruber]MCF8784036.1 glycosyltransferase [Rhodococcus ruber]